jgi:hypothetical protein
MSGLFSGNYNLLTKLIFDFYDFNKDNLLCSEDIRLVLSYIPLNTNNKILKYSAVFEDRIESQVEITGLLEALFKSEESVTYSEYVYAIENYASEILIYVNFKLILALGVYL